MNALAILQHAYTSIAENFPKKTAFEIVEDVESLAGRLVAAAKAVESALASPTADAAKIPQG